MTAWEQTQIATNGIHLNAYRAGDSAPAQPTVILLHGITDSGRCWGRIGDALAADYSVVALDARGHGHSAAPEHGYGAPDHAADVAGVIHTLELDRPILVGHSMGAELAATVAAEYPALVRAVVLEDPPWYTATLSSEARQAMLENWVKGGQSMQVTPLETLIASHREQHPLLTDEEHRAWAEAKHQVSLNALQFVGEDRPGFRDLLARITCPLLLITGDPARGALVTPEIAAEVATHPMAQLVHFPSAGHSVRRHVPDGYLEAVRAFLHAQSA